MLRGVVYMMKSNATISVLSSLIIMTEIYFLPLT